MQRRSRAAGIAVDVRREPAGKGRAESQAQAAQATAHRLFLSTRRAQSRDGQRSQRPACSRRQPSRAGQVTRTGISRYR